MVLYVGRIQQDENARNVKHITMWLINRSKKCSQLEIRGILVPTKPPARLSAINM